MRDADEGVEVLLLKRVHSAGFVPGAYVFPGGRVDAEDADPVVMSRTASLTMEGAAERMGLRDASPPAAAYYLAALREAFEETGILVGRSAGGDPLPTAAASSSVREVRNRLLDEGCSFAQALEDLDALIDDAAMEYIGHWITPIAEPQRYDARFFAAEVAARGRARYPRRRDAGSDLDHPCRGAEEDRRGLSSHGVPHHQDAGVADGFPHGVRGPEGVPPALHTERTARLIRIPDGIGLRIPEII